jgi:tRNA/rRNA methyltransferase
VLHRPKSPENIGAAARAMRNMGLQHLVVVDPKDFNLIKILRMATHAASNVVKQIESFTSLKEALSEFHYTVGTTARKGKQRLAVHTPERIVEKLIPVSRDNRIAVVFGPEDKGLSNADIRLCDVLVNIPTAEFSSLNLAQAVMIMCYEIFSSVKKEKEEFVPRLATRHELEEMYEPLKDILVRIDFINAENPDYWMNNLRRFFSRMRLRAGEVSTIRGICRQINWYAGKCYNDGLNAHRKDTSYGEETP